MTCTQALLEKLAPDIEKELKPRLQGFIGAFVRAYLPQVWVFETEEGATSVRIEPTGAVTVGAGPTRSPDVTVHGPHDRLKKILSTRTKGGARPTEVSVVAHTAKGRAALEQVRSRFGF
ncbi:MAG TPA: hypothetical protein VK424_00815 [Thermoplasmata archaeon]|nr:hypothetical protein [Thermoplasmata archaeon]